jgi:hypothetical protein
MKDEYSTARSNKGNARKHFVTLKQFDGGSPKDDDASTTRTEVSTDLEDCSIHERFSFASTSLQSANGGPSTTYAASFDSNIANFPSTIGRTPTPVDVITSTESYEIVSQLTGPKERYHNTYGHSLVDLDEDDTSESPRRSPSPVESMFIGANANDTESRVNFYAPYATNNGVTTNTVRQRLNRTQSTGSVFIGNTADTESRAGYYKQSSVTSLMRSSSRSLSIETKVMDSRNDFNVVDDIEEPLSCRDKVVEPVLTFNSEDEFDWLTETTMKIEAKKKEEKNNDCGQYASGVAKNIRSFVARCGSCFSSPQV